VWADQNVAWEEGFEVYEREGVGGCVEDLVCERERGGWGWGGDFAG